MIRLPSSFGQTSTRPWRQTATHEYVVPDIYDERRSVKDEVGMRSYIIKFWQELVDETIQDDRYKTNNIQNQRNANQKRKIVSPRSIPIHGPLDPSPPRTHKTAFLVGDDVIIVLDAISESISRLPNPISCKGRFMREG